MTRQFTVLLSLLLFAAGSAPAKDPMNHGIVRPIQKYKVKGKLADAGDISGGSLVGQGRIVVVGDELEGATFLELDDDKGTLRVIEKLKLDPEGTSELDAEGIAIDGRKLYFTGSHGISRVSKKYQTPRYYAAEVLLDGSGAPIGPVRFFTFRNALKTASATAPHWKEKLQDNGVNVEGFAVDGGNFYLGLRSPSHGKNCVIVVADSQGQFVKEFQLPFGRGYGVRAIENVPGGFLLLLGGSDPDADALAFPSVVAFWNGSSPEIEPIGILGGAKGKPEALIYMGEKEGRFEVLIFSDSAPDGSPRKYRLLPRKSLAK